MSASRNGYIGRAPGDSSIVIAKQYFQPTGAGQTFIFDSGYDPGYVDVYRNGIKLISPLDYAATDGKNVVLSTPVGVGSTVQVVAYKAFNAANVSDATDDFTVGSNLYVTSGFGSFASLTVSDINVTGAGSTFENLNVQGITTTVDINVSGSATVTGSVTAGSFIGDGSGLDGISAGLGTALSETDGSPLLHIFKCSDTLNVAAATSARVDSDATSGFMAFMREGRVVLGAGATFTVGAGTTLVTNVLSIF